MNKETLTKNINLISSTHMNLPSRAKVLIYTLLATLILSVIFISFLAKSHVTPDISDTARSIEKVTEATASASVSNFNSNSQSSEELFLVTRVVDGDTIEIEGGKMVRYIGVDTPETVNPSMPVQCFGKEASAKNKELVEGKKVRLEKDISETDRYGRLLRYVYVGDMFVNEYLVKEGYATSYSYPPDVKYQDSFIKAEAEARNASKGLWGEICKTCFYGTEVTRKCTACNKASVIRKNADCTEYTSVEGDNSCTALCSTETPSTVPVPTAVNKYICNCSKLCSQMDSCEEAYYQLDTCGCSKRDGDSDGVPCENICN